LMFVLAESFNTGHCMCDSWKNVYVDVSRLQKLGIISPFLA
jgi:hypothetical protein